MILYGSLMSLLLAGMVLLWLRLGQIRSAADTAAALLDSIRATLLALEKRQAGLFLEPAGRTGGERSEETANQSNRHGEAERMAREEIERFNRGIANLLGYDVDAYKERE